MHDLAEQALARHVQRRQHVASVADIFQQHVGRAGAQLRAQHVPVVFQRDPGDDFAGDRDLRLHRFDRLRRMLFPRRHDEHRIDAGLRVHRTPCIAIAGEHLRLRLAGLRDALQRLVDHVRIDVADGGHRHVVATQQFLQMHLAAHADAEHADLEPLALFPQAWLGERGQRCDGRRTRGGRDEEIPAIHGRADSGRHATARPAASRNDTSPHGAIDAPAAPPGV